MSRSAYASKTLAAAVVALVACQSPQDPIAPNTLVALRTATPPDMNAGAADAVWSRARPLTAAVADGANFGAKPGETADTKVTLKAAYTADTLYLLIQYADPTLSLRRGPYRKLADGSWGKLKDPADKGGDDNVYYEDKWALIWPIGNSVAGFETKGCSVLCHLGQGKPYGNKYTAKEGELADMWHSKNSRTVPLGFVDDQYVDHTRYDPQKSRNAGRKSDPGTASGEYTAFNLVNGQPQYMAREARAGNRGGTYYIKRGDEVAFDDGRFRPGDEVASYIVNPLQGDRADIRVVTGYSGGVYSSVVSRRLMTGSRYDVQFGDLAARYAFGFAAFDNAQVRHATTDDPLFLVFGR